MKAIRNTIIMVLCLTLLFSCARKENAEPKVVEKAEIEDNAAEERVSVTVYCYDIGLIKGLTPLLEERFPEVDLQVITGVNNMSYLNEMNERGYLPDIICMRRFSLNDAKYIRSNLMDLSKTEVAATFHSSILEQNRDEDGSIRWLPSCAEIDGLIASRRLFKENGLELPKNYGEFKHAMEVFNEKGINPFLCDFRYDYTCMEVLQGLSISRLMTLEGISWRQKYESEKEGEHVLLDEEVWLPVFEKFYSFISDAYLDASDATVGLTNINNEFNTGKAAVSRNTVNACTLLASTTDLDPVMLPYFGETEDENWILTYPTYQLAVSAEVEKDERKKQVVIDIVSLMLSEEGEKATVMGAPLLSYTMTNDVEFSSTFDTILPEIERNHIYMRLASTEFFDASKIVVQGILNGNYPQPQDALDAFNEILSKDPVVDNTVLCTSSVAADNVMTENGNKAESSNLNMIHNGIWMSIAQKKISYTESEGYVKPDVSISFSGLNQSPIFQGDYTKTLLDLVACPRKTVYLAELTGEEIEKFMTEIIDTRENGRNPILHENMVPVVSGFSFRIKNNGDGSFTYMGSTIEKEKTYNVFLTGNLSLYGESSFLGTPISPELRNKLVSLNVFANQTLANIAMNGGCFAEATPYLEWM